MGPIGGRPTYRPADLAMGPTTFSLRRGTLSLDGEVGSRRPLLEFKPCLEAFMTACQICGGRDVVEEFLAAKIWPLSAGWAPLRFERKRFAGLEYDMLSRV